MEKKDATWKNIEEVLKVIQSDCLDAESYASDASSHADSAASNTKKLIELLKIRKEYEGQSLDIEDYLKNMKASIGNLNHNLEKIRKETEDDSK